MRWLGRLALLLGVLVLLMGGAVMWALSMLSATPPGLATYAGVFAERYQPAIAILAAESDALQRVDPLDAPVPSHALLQFVQAQRAEQMALEQTAAYKAYRVPPRGYNQGTEAELAALHHAAQAMRDAGIGYDLLGELSRDAMQRRRQAGFTEPLLAIQGTLPNYRAVVTGRALPQRAALAKGRGALQTAPVPPTAPLDPFYPLAIAAATDAEGLGFALEEISTHGWTIQEEIECGFALGTLFWWQLDSDSEALFAMLARDEGAGTPLMRMAALSGMVQGLNNMLLADDPYDRAEIIALIGRWADQVEAPWMDQAAADFFEELPGQDSFVLVGRCPAYKGYIERLDAWSVAPEPGRHLITRAYFAQSGYVGYVARDYPEVLREIIMRVPYEDRTFNRLIFQSYLDEVGGSVEYSQSLWVQAMQAGLQGEALNAGDLARAFASRRAGDWRDLWPEIERYLRELASQERRQEFVGHWPFMRATELPVVPMRDNTDIDDPAFLRAIADLCRELWPETSTAFHAAIVETLLPRLVLSELPLDGWQPYASEITPHLQGIRDREVAVTLREQFDPQGMSEPDP